MQRLLPKTATKIQRHGAAAVECALLLPLLVLLIAAAGDFARIYYNTQVIADCARVGALYLANPDVSDKSEYETAEAIVLECAKNLSPAPTVLVFQDKNATPPFVEVTVTQKFSRLFPFVLPSVPPEIVVTRKSRARFFPSALESD